MICIKNYSIAEHTMWMEAEQSFFLFVNLLFIESLDIHVISRLEVFIQKSHIPFIPLGDKKLQDRDTS